VGGSGRPRRLRSAVQKLAVRVGRGPLGALWPLVYATFERAVPVFLLWGRDGSAYVSGGTARDQPLWGISDIDLYCVVPPDAAGRGVAREAVLERWRRLRRVLPFIDAVVGVWVYEDLDLSEAGEPYLTFGLDAAPDAPRPSRALFYDGRPGAGYIGLRIRPGLFGSFARSRLIHGEERLPREPVQDDARRRIAAWSELQWFWSFAFERCLDPTHPSTTYLAAKLIIEPIRILLWISNGMRVLRRPEVISIALERYPQHRQALLLARELMAHPLGPGDRGHEDDHRRALSDAFPHLVALSREVAARIDAGMDGERTPVRLLGVDDAPLREPGGAEPGASPGARPMCDWRVLCMQRWPDAGLALVNDAVTPDSIATLMATPSHARQPVLRAGGDLLVMPESPSTIRCIASPFSDPVSTALVAGSSTARFAPAPGFAATDWARRGIAEREAQIATTDRGPTPRRIGLLLASARAGLFADSLADGEPVLPLTAAASARRLAERDSRQEPAIEAALEACASGEARAPATAADELEGVVTSLLDQTARRLQTGPAPVARQ
jgi:hypothetical protein